MNRPVTRSTVVTVGAFSLLLGSCSMFAPKPDPSKFFVLTPLPAVDARASRGEIGGSRPGRGVALGLGPVEFPGYLDRPELVTRIPPNEIAMSQTNRWAESLHANFSRVLAENLGTLLDTDQIALYPWYQNVPLDYQVEIEIIRFERIATAGAQLIARWSIKTPSDGKYLYVKQSSYNRPAEADAESAVAALSGAVGDLSIDIASQIKHLRAVHEQR